MPDFRLPVDFERLNSFQQLKGKLQGAIREAKVDIDAEAMATVVWVRLWVAMAYQAAENNTPGKLVASGSLFGSWAWISENTILDYLTAQPFPLLTVGDGGYFCERFSKANPHLAGNYTSPEKKGAVLSALERSKRRIAQAAMFQSTLLQPDIYKRRDGNTLSSSEINRLMVLIKTIDNLLHLPPRQNGQFSEGLIADAADVTSKYPQEVTDEFLKWLAVNREVPSVPKTTEEVLRNFDALNGAIRLLRV